MRLLFLLATAPAAWAGCATVPRQGPPATELERTNLELRARNAGYVRRTEELENRIFILEDQLDSRKLAAEQRAPAVLPVRVLRADSPSQASSSLSPIREGASYRGSPAATPALTTVDDGSGLVVTSIVAEHPVDYAGEAAQPMASPLPRRSGTRRRRPVLRLSATKVEPVEAEPAPAPAYEAGPQLRHASLGGTSGGRLKTYREALDTMQRGRPDVALEGFRRFVEENPQHEYADNAQYLIGECLFEQKQLVAAARAYRRVVEQYPRGNKVPEAMLKLGITLQTLGDDPGGRAVLESLARSFPKHEAARQAVSRLAHPEPVPPDKTGASTFGTILPAVPVPPPGAGGDPRPVVVRGAGP